MTHTQDTQNAGTAAADRIPPETVPVLDVQQLAKDLFEKVAAAQLDLLRARAARDHQSADEHLLRLRATALLLACLPAHPDSEAYRLKVIAVVALREEDGAEASHAWVMAERALERDQWGQHTATAD